MNRLILKLLLAPTFLWKRMGVDPEKLRLILSVKLTIDDRRPLTAFGNSQKKKESSGSNIWQFIIMAIMGSVFLIYFLFLNDSYVAYSFYFFSLMCVLGLMLIADLSTILIDTRDHYIILPRPVDDRTFAVSRVLHIGILLLGLLVALALPGLIYTGIKYGIGLAILFLLQALITGMLTLLLVNQFYLMMIRWLPAQRLKDLIAMVQVVFSVAVFASYYFGPVVLRTSWAQQLHIESAPWSWVFPPVWVASLQQLAAQPLTWLVIVLSLLGLIAPLVALWLVIRIFSAGFNDKLAALAGGDESTSTRNSAAGIKRTWGDRLSSALTRHPLESAGFRIVWLITGRSREFKQKLYPTMAYIPVYFVFSFFSGSATVSRPGHLATGWSKCEKAEHLSFCFTCLCLRS